MARKEKMTTFASEAAAQVTNIGEFEFVQWITKHNKNYTTVEEWALRLERFLFADAHIKMVNAPNFLTLATITFYFYFSFLEKIATLTLLDIISSLTSPKKNTKA